MIMIKNNTGYTKQFNCNIKRFRRKEQNTLTFIGEKRVVFRRVEIFNDGFSNNKIK